MSFYDDIDSFITPNTYEVGDVNTMLNSILGSWCVVILFTIFYDFFIV